MAECGHPSLVGPRSLQERRVYHCKLDVLMVARYFTPQHGLKGWSERGGTSGVAPITKGRGQWPCSITILSLYIKG